MKKSVSITGLSILLACSFQVTAAASVFASTARINSATDVARTALVAAQPRDSAHLLVPSGRRGQNNQNFSGYSIYGEVILGRGRNQLNTGNQGINRRHNQDNTVNSGNQIINSGASSSYGQRNQHFVGYSNVSNYYDDRGYNQGNWGNQGDNRGDNQNNSTNTGNQSVN